MTRKDGRRERLHRLIDFARVYRGWKRTEVAAALNRDSTKLYPATDNPKLDMLVALAEVLDWSVSDVVEYLWDGDGAARDGQASFEALDQEALAAHTAGDFHRLVGLARQMYRVAATPEERARACNREVGAWDGLGRYTNALEAAHRGLQQCPLPSSRRFQLQTNLANMHYALWQLSAAQAHAHLVIESYTATPPVERIDRKNAAFAFYVRGQTLRCMAATQPDQCRVHAAAARSDLAECIERYQALAEELNDQRLSGIANTCRGALYEVNVELSAEKPEAAVDALLAGLDAVVDPAQQPIGDWLESFGWWCIFGANIALRHLSGRNLQHCMAVFANKALEIADRMNNWALRERVFSMQYRLHEILVDTTGLDLPYVLDEDEKRLITGAMGRFPSFRDTGWKIFRAARVLSA